MVAHCCQHGLSGLPCGGQDLHGLCRSSVQQVAGRAYRRARRGAEALKQDMTNVVRLFRNVILGCLIGVRVAGSPLNSTALLPGTFDFDRFGSCKGKSSRREGIRARLDWQSRLQPWSLKNSPFLWRFVTAQQLQIRRGQWAGAKAFIPFINTSSGKGWQGTVGQGMKWPSAHISSGCV